MAESEGRTDAQLLAALRAEHRQLLIDITNEIQNQTRRTNGVRLDVINRIVEKAKERMRANSESR